MCLLGSSQYIARQGVALLSFNPSKTLLTEKNAQRAFSRFKRFVKFAGVSKQTQKCCDKATQHFKHIARKLFASHYPDMTDNSILHAGIARHDTEA